MSSAAKRSSAVGAADQYEMDQLAEVELQKLQRQVHTAAACNAQCIL